MLDWWERLIFNIIMASVFVGTVIPCFLFHFFFFFFSFLLFSFLRRRIFSFLYI